MYIMYITICYHVYSTILRVVINLEAMNKIKKKDTSSAAEVASITYFSND